MADYGNGGMQTEEEGEQYPEYCMPYEAPGGPAAKGGDLKLVNQDEDDMTAYIIESTKCRTGALSNEDDSHVQGVYRETDFAGS